MSEAILDNSYHGNERELAADSLTRRLERGDAAALTEVYNAHRARVWTVARRMIGDSALAEDLVQEVFIRLPQAIRRYRGESSLGSFILGIAINNSKHYVRTAARRRQLAERQATESPPAASPSPDAAMDDHRLADAIARALDELSLAQRAAFVLCEVDQQTSVQAAAILGIPDATVRTRLHAAKQRLRQRLIEGGWR